jgi:hypothetical protein
MSGRIKISSAMVWYALAFVLMTTPFLGNLDGLLFPPIDRKQTAITVLKETEGLTLVSGTFVRTRPCVFKGTEFYTRAGVLIDARRVGKITDAVVGVNSFGPWLLAETVKNAVCDMRMETKYACYWDSVHFPLITTAVFYDGSESNDPMCAGKSP